MARMCIRLFPTVILIVLLGVGTAVPQEQEAPAEGPFRMGVTAGLTAFSLGELRDFTSGLLAEYKNSGLPVELERDYPPNLLVSAECVFVGPQPWALGLSGSYTWTSAYGLYADYAGTLDLHSKVQVLSGYLVVQHSFSAGSTFQPFVDIRAGVCWVFLSIEETVDATEYADMLVTSDVSGNEFGFAGEASVGLRYPFGSLALTGRVGYRYSNVPSMEVELSSSGQNLGSGTLGFDVNASGFLGLLTLEVML